MNHPKTSELLPWYVNGTLGIGDRQAAALEVSSCDECAKDVDELMRLQAAMLEMEALAPEPSEFGITRALAAVEAEEEKKRLGHPWFGWWWALTPFRRALTVSSVLGVLVALGIFAAPKPPAATTSSLDQGATPIALEKVVPPGDVRGATNARSATFAQTAGAVAVPAPMPANAESAIASNTPVLRTDTQIARTGSVSLLVPDVEAAIAKISSLVRAQGGEVMSLNDQTPSQPGERHTATLQVGVPVNRFDDAVASLGKLGGLQSRSISAENVATQIVDAQARLRNLRSTESDLLGIMSRAGKIDDVLSVENQVSATREQIEQLDGELQALKHRVAMSTISVDLEDEVPAASVEVGMGAQLRDTWTAALRSVKIFTIALLGGLLWGLAYAPYVLGVALLGGLIAWRWHRA